MSWLRYFLAIAIWVIAPVVRADDFHETLLVRQLAAASVFVSLCPTITFGAGLAAIENELGITKADIEPGGRYYEAMAKATSELKAIKSIAGTDNADATCSQALKTYGPAGFAYRNLVRSK